ncbi:MAG: hypothetical protein AAFZ15_03720 [Bacteroidota bacterium]
MRLFQSFLPFLFLAFLFSCQKDETANQIPEVIQAQNVDPALQPYFEEFEYQAALRGIEVDLTAANIIGNIQEITEEHVAGQCTYGAAIDNEITIDQGFWNSFPQYLIREMVVFHELGHCYLERGHREGSFSNGACISIMRSGLEECRDNYNSSTRSDYLDELFSDNN